MTRSIDTEILAQLDEGTLRTFHLLEIIIDGESYKFTDCDIALKLPDDILLSVEDIAISIDGTEDESDNRAVPRLYIPVTDFAFTALKYSKAKIVDKAEISMSMINNPDMLLAFAGGTPQGSRVLIREIVLDDNYEVVGETSAELFEGKIDAWTMDEVNLRFTAVSEMSQWTQKGLRKHSPSCTWKKFKGQTEDSPCFYSGEETWCDRSYKRCGDLSNTANFGGFKFLASIINKEIWWGREKKQD